jgi:hypothetical protein
MPKIPFFDVGVAQKAFYTEGSPFKEFMTILTYFYWH